MGTGAMNSGWWDRIRMVAWHLWKNGRESMGSPILNVMIAALNRVELITFDRDVTADRLDHVLAAIDCVIEGRKSTTASIREVFTSYLHNQYLSKGDPNSPITILTLSASSTIRECIIHAATTLDALGLDIRLLESRPLYEGVSFASTLLSQFQSRLKTSSVKITLYPDAAAALASSGVDVLLLGADRIAASGAVSNKTGSLPASLSVRHISPAAKVVVLSELEKVAEPGQTGLHVVEENDITEIVGGWQREKVRGLEIIQGALQGRGSTENPGLSLEVKNIYFEWVPPELVDAYVCENGVHAVSEIQERSHWVGQQAERLFGGL
ncbi:hypothetical protein Egran_03885 [Elaphomyces granulatus]|uniref:Uncharacterized protein n=1 Tax=Elaphomyces granulatus TaxID=519963 RepID=A0A232LW60_9EURO|nr:hypothetical protein Egran_03885 [Elaphomyces granulatus]